MPRLSCCPEMCPVCCLLGLSHITGGLSCDSFCNLAVASAMRIIFFFVQSLWLAWSQSQVENESEAGHSCRSTASGPCCAEVGVCCSNVLDGV